MTALAIIVVALVVMGLASGFIVTRLWNHATVAEANRWKAEDAEHDAKAQEAYAKIATDGRTIDDTGRVLDDGRFFLRTDQDLQPRGTEGSSGRASLGEKPHP